jgi:hypothetical protein
MGTEQHTTEKPMGDRHNKGRNQKVPGTQWDIAKAMLRGKFRAISAYIQKTETTQINNAMMHLKLQEKQEQTKPKTSRRENNKDHSQNK